MVEMCVKMKGARGRDSVGELMGVQKNVPKLLSTWLGSRLLECCL